MSSRPTLYFGYGSNIWLDQMRRRCPESRYIGLGHLSDWRWIINTAGYATIVPSKGDEVYAFMYELTRDDEARLDGYEGVPINYEKQIHPVKYTPKGEHGLIAGGKGFVDALIYVDVQRMEEGEPRHEYIHRINMAIADGLKEGIPRAYFDKYFRPVIPPEDLKA